MKEPEPLPPGVASNEIAVEPPPRSHVIRPEAGFLQVQGSSAVLLLTPASHHLLAHARSLAEKGEHQFAVVFAHAACELHTEGELIRLLAPRKDRELAELVAPDRGGSLADNWPRELYTRLTGDNPQQASWWEPWTRSRKDRHAVAHAGAQMTRAQADAAINVADSYIRHVTEKVEAALQRPHP